jgi:hypothetical protein
MELGSTNDIMVGPSDLAARLRLARDCEGPGNGESMRSMGEGIAKLLFTMVSLIMNGLLCGPSDLAARLRLARDCEGPGNGESMRSMGEGIAGVYYLLILI